MRIGIHPALKRHDGGIYQYSVAFLEALDDCAKSERRSEAHTFVVFAHDTEDPILRKVDEAPTRTPTACRALADIATSGLSRNPLGLEASARSWEIVPFRPPWAPTPSIDLLDTPEVDDVREQADMRAWIRECGVELMLYPSPHRLSFEAGIPFVIAVHDLQHRLQPEFPEVSANGEWARREYVVRNAVRSATLVIAESAVGRDDIVNAYGSYGVRSDRIRVLPYAPDSSIQLAAARAMRSVVSAKYNLPERYVFYPAQFWPHKNHLRLVEALALLRRERGATIPLVLTGSGVGEIREGIVRELRERCAALGIEEQVRWLGYVSDEEKFGLYAGATALVMPTFFGPTNLPFLEAWALDCPVLTSRIRGIVEQVDEAAVKVDPRNVWEIAQGIFGLWSDETLRARLVMKGREKIEAYTAADFQDRLAAIVDEAVGRVALDRGEVQVA